MERVITKELLARISLNDDEQAYRRFFVHYHPRLLQFAQSITLSRETAEEVVSDVFLKIWNIRDSLLEIRNLPLYLYVITRNRSINTLEKQKRERTCWLDDSQVELRSFYYDPEQLMISSEMFRRIEAAVQALPPRCRMIFKLVKEDGFSYAETADLLQLSVKTVEAQMTIALRKLGAAIPFRKTSSL